MSKVIAITGIGGFIGLAMAKRAKTLGWQVQGLEQDRAAGQAAQALGARVIFGDINDTQALSMAITGADYVFHTAAVVAESGPRSWFERVNVDGTDAVATVAEQQGVARLVHLSSVMVYGFQCAGTVTEQTPFADQGNLYNETKARSEQRVLRCDKRDGMRVVVIRPGDVYGPDSQPWVQRPLTLMRKRLFQLPDNYGYINHVYISNLLDGVVAAFNARNGGVAYNISDGVATSCADFFRYHSHWLGQSPVPVVPALAMNGLLSVVEQGARLVRKPPPATKSAIGFLQRQACYSIVKAQTELKYQPAVGLAEGMERVEKVLRERGTI